MKVELSFGDRRSRATVGFLNSEFDHTGAQSAGIDPENAGRPPRTVDSPIEIFKYPHDVVPLHVFERFDGCG